LELDVGIGLGDGIDAWDVQFERASANTRNRKALGELREGLSFSSTGVEDSQVVDLYRGSATMGLLECSRMVVIASAGAG
jgi:hypothetical protein